jgi:RHS repeat-associated protein
LDYETGDQDYGMRISNSNLGRFLSVDPLSRDYPFLTPYQFASNRPIDGVDLDGQEWIKFTLSVWKDPTTGELISTSEREVTSTVEEKATYGNSGVLYETYDLDTKSFKYDYVPEVIVEPSVAQNIDGAITKTNSVIIDNVKTAVGKLDANLYGSYDKNAGGWEGDNDGANTGTIWKKEVDATATGLQWAGKGTKYAGTALLPTPLAPLGVTLRNVGEGIELSGDVLEIGQAYYEGGYDKAKWKTINLAMNGAVGWFLKKVGAPETTKAVVGDAVDAVSDEMTDKIIKQNETKGTDKK